MATLDRSALKSPNTFLPWTLAAAATLLLFSWQALTVHGLYGGHWTSLFYAGDARPMPPDFPIETYIHNNSTGYDGQWYRLVAHDPFLARGYSRYVDRPELRYRRILLPALAWTLAAGNPRFIDTAYFLLILFSVFLATAFASLWLPMRSLSPYWALLVPLLPGVLAFANRLTVDGALYAAICAAFLAAHRGRTGAVWLALAAAALSRDLGLLLVAAFAFHALLSRRWPQAVLFLSAAVPTLAWYLFLDWNLPPADAAPFVPNWLFRQFPLRTHVQALFTYNPYNFSAPLNLFTNVLDRFVLLSAFFAAILAFLRLRKPAWQPFDLLLAGFGILYLFTGNLYFWRDTLSAARAFTPMFALLAISPAHATLHWRILPLAALTLRILWEFTPLTWISILSLLKS